MRGATICADKVAMSLTHSQSTNHPADQLCNTPQWSWIDKGSGSQINANFRDLQIVATNQGNSPNSSKV